MAYLLNGLQTRKGQIQVIFGPMFSGKTTELIRRLKRYQIANYKCLIIKYANDNRYDKSGIATHDQQTLSAMAAVELSSKKDISRMFDVIGIDEGQFFPDTVEFAEEMADQGKIVIVAALDATFQRVGFGNILNLVPLAECVVKLTAVCMKCYSDASYTKRRGSEKEIEVIGGADKYMAVCRDCYKSPLKNRSHSTEKSPKKIRSPLKEVNENITPLEDTESVVKRNLFSNEDHVMHEAC